LQDGLFFCIFVEIIKQQNMFKKIKSFFKSLLNSKFEPTIPTTPPAGELANSQEWVEANSPDTPTFYWDGTVEGSPMETESTYIYSSGNVGLDTKSPSATLEVEAPKKKKRKPYKKRNNNNNQPKQVDQLGLPKMKANDETPRPKSNKRRGRRPNNAQNGNSASSTPQKG